MSKTAILCVDDEVIVLNSLKTELRRAFGNQYLYEFAESAEEALEIIAELEAEGNSVCTVISDWWMPQMKGDDFLIKVHQSLPATVTIMLTGQASDEAIADATRQANLHACIRKPWQFDRLIATIKSGLAGKAADT